MLASGGLAHAGPAPCQPGDDPPNPPAATEGMAFRTDGTKAASARAHPTVGVVGTTVSVSSLVVDLGGWARTATPSSRPRGSPAGLRGAPTLTTRPPPSPPPPLPL